MYTFKEEKGNRVLVIVDRVPNDDIESGELFSNSAAGNMIERLMYDADAMSGNNVEEIAFINFHEFRIHDLDPALKNAAEADFTVRIEKFIKRYKPDVVIAMGRDVINAVTEFNPQDQEGNDPAREFGRLTKLKKFSKKIGKRVNVLYTFGVFDFCPDIRFNQIQEDTKRLQSVTSLAGILLRHFDYAFRNKNIHNISTKPFITKYVDTIKKFNKLMRYVSVPTHVNCIDTETQSLARHANALLSIQFAAEPAYKPLSPEKQIAWFLPIEHPDAPWNPKEIKYIKKKLRDYLERGASQCLIMQNAKFDLTQLASQIGIRFFNHEVYGVDNGEYALEENLKLLSDKKLGHLGISAYGLASIMSRYGWSSAYDNTGVDKNNRSGFQEMNSREFLLYGCTDVIGPLRLRQAQLKRAEYEGFDKVVFERAVTGILSDMEHVFSDMERNGHFVDVNYLTEAIRPNGIVDKRRASNVKKFLKSKAAKRVNKNILQSKGAPKKSLFGGEKIGKAGEPWEFSIKTMKHQQELFFKELGLKPLKERKDGGGSIDKTFLEKHGTTDEFGQPVGEYVKEVGWYAEMKKYDTLMTNFIRPINRQIVADPDAVLDGRIRSNFQFRNIITGRSGSSRDKKRDVGINFQNIPSHGGPAKTVKRVFITPDGRLIIKVDFGAHEVRNWSNISGDTLLADRFKDAINLKRKFSIEVDADKLDKIIEKLKKRGDIHIQNVKFFFDKWVDKKHPLRQQIKAVVFGVMYGKSSYGLSSDLNIEVDEAQELINKLFNTFKDGGDWLQGTIRTGRNIHVVETPFGLKRHLWGHYHPNEGIKRAMDRRGPNSCIQGVSSQMGYMAGRNLQKMKWEYFTSQDYHLGLRHANSVHDSMELDDEIRSIPISIYLIEHAMTTQVAKVCRERYDFELKVDLDVEFELGGSLADLDTWNNRYADLPALVEDKMKWTQDNLGYNTSKKEFKSFLKNCEIVAEIRKREVEKDLKKKKFPSETMLLTHKDVKQFDIRKDS